MSSLPPPPPRPPPSPSPRPPPPRPSPRPPPPSPPGTAIQWPGAVVITFTIIAFIVMAGEWVGPDIVFSALLAFFTAFGSDFDTKLPRIITLADAAAGYNNTGLLTVMFLYTMAEGLTQTGGLEYMMSYVLGRSRSTHSALVRSTLPVAFLSAFLNNTPIVSIFTPILISWGRRNGVPVKKLLIPLSYAAVLGGTCSLIGTSTNLVIASSQDKRYGALKFKLFDIAPWGVPYAVWGLMFIYVTQSFLLPGNTSRHGKNLFMGLRILPASLLPGQTLENSRLSKAHGCSVAGIGRGGSFIGSPPLDFVLNSGDVVYFAGDLNSIEYIAEEFGLALVTQEAEGQVKTVKPEGAFTANGASPYTKLVRLTLKPGSELVGLTVGAAGLRGRVGVSLIAIKRRAERVDSLLSDTVLLAGDVLLVDAGDDFIEKSEQVTSHFDQITPVKDGLAKEFIIAMRVKKGPGDVAGKTLSQAGLRGIPGLHPMSIDKADGRSVDATDYSVFMEPGDVVWFAADLASVTFLNKFIGMELLQQEQVDKTSTSILYRQFAQAVVAGNSPLVGMTIRDAKFRRRYNAAVVAVHRQDVRVALRVADITLQAGDVLLLSCDNAWCNEHRYDRSFVLIKDVADSSPPKRKGMVTSVLLVVGLVLIQVIGGVQDNKEYMHLWPCAVLVGVLMLALGCFSADQWRRSFLWDVYLTIAAAFGISKCMENTYVAKNFAEVFIRIGKETNSTGGALTAIYIATALMSEMLTNNAAGAIMYPIAAIAGDALKVSPTEVSVAIMLGASAGFINPFSYQCNLMVYAAGGYTFKEFAIIGAPFQVFLAFVAAFILCLRQYWREQWIVCWLVYVVVAGVPMAYTALPSRFTLALEERIMRLFRRSRHSAKVAPAAR